MRPAEPRDAQALLALTIELGYASDLHEIEARLSRLLDHGEHALLVAESGGEVAGLCDLRLCEQIESPAFAEIAALVVGERFRGQGHGTALVAAAQAWARARGLPELRVRTNVRRTRTQAFYRALGFEGVKEQAVFRRRVAPGAASG